MFLKEKLPQLLCSLNRFGVRIDDATAWYIDYMVHGLDLSDVFFSLSPEMMMSDVKTIDGFV